MPEIHDLERIQQGHVASAVERVEQGRIKVVGIKMGTVVYPEMPYTGEYVVTPHFAVQTLATNGHQMLDDVTVLEIPVTRTTNPQGGQTVVIG